MTFSKVLLLAAVCPVVTLAARVGLSPHIINSLGPQGVNLWRLRTSEYKTGPVEWPDHSHGWLIQEPMASSFSSGGQSTFAVQWFTQPLDHFSDCPHTFRQRFWVNTRHYRPYSGGPVYVLDSGETSGEGRLPFLDTGIMDILAKATGGVSVVLEHRYYGESMPVSNFSTDSLRWLNNAQSAADSANFMANVKFDGIDEDLTAPNTPWIYYGGSYAGARAAHMRVLYPDLVYGAIASSAVTHASLAIWEYMEVIRLAAEPKCASNLENSIQTIDQLLGGRFSKPLKALFGLGALGHDEDFASVISEPLAAWQAKNWDPKVGNDEFDKFCAALDRSPFSPFDDISELPYGDERRMVSLSDDFAVDFTIWNYAKYIKKNVVGRCPQRQRIEDCFGTFNDAKFQGTSLDEDWRPWLFQVCTEWGYFVTAPPDQKHPRIISSLLRLEYLTRICHQAYLPGKHFRIPSLPNITSVNALGDFGIAADRLAIIDGELDPWRPATPHSEYANEREDTVLQPFKIIPNAVHHYDENGLRDISLEPPEIRKVHQEMIEFVQAWLKDWKTSKRSG